MIQSLYVRCPKYDQFDDIGIEILLQLAMGYYRIEMQINIEKYRNSSACNLISPKRKNLCDRKLPNTFRCLENSQALNSKQLKMNQNESVRKQFFQKNKKYSKFRCAKKGVHELKLSNLLTQKAKMQTCKESIEQSLKYPLRIHKNKENQHKPMLATSNSRSKDLILDIQAKKKTRCEKNSKTCREILHYSASQRSMLSCDILQVPAEDKNCLTLRIRTKNQEEKVFRVRADNLHNLRKFLQSKGLYSGKTNIVGFESLPENIALDYYLTLRDNKSISCLNRIEACFTPIVSRQSHQRVNLNSFNIIKCIGTGGFSNVFLVRFKEDGKFYAMKVIDKKFIIKNKKEMIVLNERNVMKVLKHPFTVQMKFAFESRQSIIFVLEFYPGGELFGLVRKFRIMEEEMAKFYIVEILLGLQYIHSKSIIYRDFKPENILLDINGHIRIADFGLAKPDITDSKVKAFSFCGSPEYMPPEMIMKQGHSLPVDFYCLGALLYELVTGLPPFYSREPDEIYEGTINHPITFPKHTRISSQLKSLLKQLLAKQQQKRIGTRFGVQQVLQHPWFSSINQKDFLSKQVEPPVNFTELKDLQQILTQIEEKNPEYLLSLLKQQKQSKDKTISHIFKDFYYDWRFRQKMFDSSKIRSKKKMSKDTKNHCYKSGSIKFTKNHSKQNSFSKPTRISSERYFSHKKDKQFQNPYRLL